MRWTPPGKRKRGRLRTTWWRTAATELEMGLKKKRCFYFFTTVFPIILQLKLQEQFLFNLIFSHFHSTWLTVHPGDFILCLFTCNIAIFPKSIKTLLVWTLNCIRLGKKLYSMLSLFFNPSLFKLVLFRTMLETSYC